MISGGNRGGILGESSYNNSTKIINNYNIGIVDENEGKSAGLICGYAEGTTIVNSYYKKINNMEGVGREGITAEMPTNDNSVGYDEKDMKNSKLINDLNNYIDENKEKDDNIKNWKRWKIGDDGYPTFE